MNHRRKLRRHTKGHGTNKAEYEFDAFDEQMYRMVDKDDDENYAMGIMRKEPTAYRGKAPPNWWRERYEAEPEVK